MKLVAKCSTSVSLSYQVHVKDCNLILLTFISRINFMLSCVEKDKKFYKPRPKAA